MDIDERIQQAARYEAKATDLGRLAKAKVAEIEEIEAERERLLREARRLRQRPVAERMIGGEV